MRLPDYYLRLHRHCAHRGRHITLAEVAAALCCSERHARTLLARLAAQGWLNWQAGSGRGQRSQLQLLADPAMLEAESLQQSLAAGDIEGVMQGLGHAARSRLHAILPAYLGVQSGDTQRLRIPFYRPLHSLDPVQINRRTECHLIRQIFDGLTRFDRATQSIVPALAHHWQADDSLMRWRFQLRPGVLFHHGRALQGEDVQSTLQRLRDEAGPYQSLFTHLAEVRLAGARCVEIRLSQPDALLPHRLADSCAVILPRERWPQAGFGHLPSGSGAFRLTVNNDYRATLQAFEHYWQSRALLDEIDIWVVNDDATRARLDIRLGYHGQHPVASGDTLLQAEPGCSYVAANPARLDEQQRAALAAWLHPQHWPVDLGGQRALGLLAQWQHWPAPATPTPGRLPAQLRLVTYQLHSNRQMAAALATRLAAGGCRLETQVLSYPEFAANLWRDEADLMLLGEVLNDDLDYSCYQWLFAGSGFRPWLSAAQQDWLAASARSVMQQADSAQRWQCYAATAQRLVTEHAVIPLQHATMRLEFDPRLQGITLGNCGWMDFRQLWFEAPAQADE